MNDLITNNTCNLNTHSGIYLSDSENDLIADNACNSNAQSGIYLSDSENDLVNNNTCDSNTHHGFSLYNSDRNTVIDNTCFNNDEYGISLTSFSSKNAIYYNSFTGNNHGETQCYDNGSANDWSAPLGGGNFYSDYSTRYPGAVNDGLVWYIPYELEGSSGSRDHRPLVSPGIKYSSTFPPKIQHLLAFDTPNDNGGSITISWEPTTIPFFHHYNVYISKYWITDLDDEMMIFSNITDRNSTTYNLTSINGDNLTAWTDYYFVVTAVARGNTEFRSDFARTGPVRALNDRAPPPLSGIQGFDTPGDNGGSITLSWVASNEPDVDYYKVYYSTRNDTDITNMKHLPELRDNTSIIVDHLSNDQKYYFTVTAVDVAENEDTNAIVIGPIIPLDNLPPAHVTNLTAVDTPNDNGGSITLNWTPSSDLNVSRLRLYYFTNGSLNVLNWTCEDENLWWRKDSYVIEELENGQEYFFAVTGVDYSGNEDFDNCPIVGPVIPKDNLRPEFDLKNCHPDFQKEDLVVFVEKGLLFQASVTESDEFSFKWYVSGDDLKTLEYSDNQTYQFMFIPDENMVGRTVTIIAVANDENGLNNSLSWSVLVEKEEQLVSQTNEFISLLIIAGMIIILVIFIIIGDKGYHLINLNRLYRSIKLLPADEALSTLIDQKPYLQTGVAKKLRGDKTGDPEKGFILFMELCSVESKATRKEAINGLASIILDDPELFFVRTREMNRNNIDPNVFVKIAKTDEKNISQLASKYYDLLMEPFFSQDMVSDIEDFLEILSNNPTIKGVEEIRRIYSVLLLLLHARTMNEIAGMKSTLEKTSKEIQMFDEFLPVLEILIKVCDLINIFESMGLIDDKLSYITRILSSLETTDTLVKKNLTRPEREFILMGLSNLRVVVSHSLKEMQGRADIRISLKTKDVLPSMERWGSMRAEIVNAGRSAAENVIMEILPSSNFKVEKRKVELNSIGAVSKANVDFKIKVKIERPFRLELRIRYDDAVGKNKTVLFADTVSCIEVKTEFQKIKSPYIVGTPIVPGSPMFMGRSDILNYISENVHGLSQENILVLHGQRRTGKTSILKQLTVSMGDEYIPVFFDIQSVIDPGMGEFFSLWADNIFKALKKRVIEIEQPDFEKFSYRPSHTFNNYLSKLSGAASGKHLIFMIDEFEELERKVNDGLIDKNIFSFMRHLMQHTENIAFIFAGTHRLEELKRDYWSILFNIALYKKISFLSHKSTKELITEPIKEFNMIYDALAIEKIVRVTNGHPYFVQLICHMMVNFHNRTRTNYITIQDLNDELDNIIERGRMHFDFLWNTVGNNDGKILVAAAKLIYEGSIVTLSSLMNKLEEYNIKLSFTDISECLDRLEGNDILFTNSETGIARYEFSVDLFRMWLEKFKTLRIELGVL